MLEQLKPHIEEVPLQYSQFWEKIYNSLKSSNSFEAAPIEKFVHMMLALDVHFNTAEASLQKLIRLLKLKFPQRDQKKLRNNIIRAVL